MSVTVRPYPGGGWESDILYLRPDGTRGRDRRKTPCTSRGAAERWAAERARNLLTGALAPKSRKVVPTLAEFSARFLDEYCVAERHKESGIESKRSALRHHLLPLLGERRLDTLCDADIAELKRALVGKSASTTNNVVSTLAKMLRVAVDWAVLDGMPCRVKLVKAQPPVMKFLPDAEYEYMLAGAQAVDASASLVVLLAAEAGLRRGEIVALHWTDVDLVNRLVTVSRSVWRGRLTVTKGLHYRHLPLTERLFVALSAMPRLGERVVTQPDGSPITEKMVYRMIVAARARGGVTTPGNLHVLRHTFCSRLAVRGVPATTIQKLAGHADLKTTTRYMHLAPGEERRAIGLLDEG